MAKRLTDTSIWDKDWFTRLPPHLKCLVKYVRDKCDLAGIWSPNWPLAEFQIGKKVTEHDLISIDSGRQFKKFGQKIMCIDFIYFQYGLPLKDSSPIHRKIKSLLNEHKYPIDTLYNMVQVKEEEIVKEELEDKEEVKEEDKEKGKKEKIEFFEKVFLTEIENEKIKEKFGTAYQWALEQLSLHKNKSGTKYKSDYSAICLWVYDKFLKQKLEIQKATQNGTLKQPNLNPFRNPNG